MQTVAMSKEAQRVAKMSTGGTDNNSPVCVPAQEVRELASTSGGAVARIAARQPERESGGTRLESWKEIATYLNRHVTTVRRWERREGLPVHRHMHGARQSCECSVRRGAELARAGNNWS
jgi:hypothetical protein